MSEQGSYGDYAVQAAKQIASYLDAIDTLEGEELLAAVQQAAEEFSRYMAEHGFAPLDIAAVLSGAVIKGALG